MNIVLNLMEEWGIIAIAGLLLIYFAWHAMAFVRDQPVAFKSDPILTTTTLGWGIVWLVGNGIGNALFLFAVATMLKNLVTFYTGEFAMPALQGVEALIFLIGLMPSLYQFRYQADPNYLGTLSSERRTVAIVLTVADGLLCALGWYWWLLPPTFVNGDFTVIYDQNLVVGCLSWSIFSSYVAQFMAHMQLYELLGLQAPTLPNLFSGVGVWLQHIRGGGSAPMENTPARTVRPAKAKRRPSHTSEASTAARYDSYGEESHAMQLEELEVHP